MIFKDIDLARAAAQTLGEKIHVEIEGAGGVLEVFPGGRAIFWSDDKGKVYTRKKNLLTPDRIFLAMALVETGAIQITKELADDRRALTFAVGGMLREFDIALLQREQDLITRLLIKKAR